jgi:predicted 2-oxoglutarate/Fe(II)-dependent dioxygenase YbiX
MGSTKNIVIKENFIQKQDLDFVLSSIDDKVSWNSNSMAGIPDKVTNKLYLEKPKVHAILKDAIDRVQKEIEFHFGRPLEVNFPGIRRWDVGEYQPLPADGEDPEGHPNEAFIVDYGAVIYLNDDYEGGVISFPHIGKDGVSVKPEAGSAIFFPSNYVFVHEISSVTKGIRYALPNWYHNMIKKVYTDGTE